MKKADIEKIRHVLKKALDLVAGERIAYDTFPAEDELGKVLEDAYRVCEVELEEALALLPCEKCGGTEGNHKQVDDPQAGISHMLTKMQCPLDKKFRSAILISERDTC